MSRDVITVGSTMRILLLYRGEYSQWRERFINYLKEQTNGEAMINSIQNDDHPLPVIAQVSLTGTVPNAPPTLKDPKFWTAEEKKNRKIDCLARSLLIQGLPNDIYSLIDSNDTAKDLWDALERQMRGEQLLDTSLRYLQVINDLKKCGYKKDNYEIVYEDRGDNMERASTTAASLDAEQDSGSGPRHQDTILEDRPAQTRFERLSKQSNDPPLSGVNTPASREDRLKNYGIDGNLIKSSANKRLGDQEDASKEGRNIAESDQDEEISFVQEDVETQGRYDQDIDVTTVSVPITTIGASVSIAKPSTPLTTTNVIKDEDLTIAQTLVLWITGQMEVRLVWNNAQRVNHQNKLTHPHPKRNLVPTAVLAKSGNVLVNTAKQSSPRVAISNSTARYVNTDASKPTMNGAKPCSNVFYKSHSLVKRTIYQRTTPKNSDFKEKVNTAK
ncbi:hypothetical protein Tco_0856930, partial [Tanacetum coccineum]